MSDELRNAMRETYNRCSAGTGVPDVMFVPCEHCGGVVSLVRQEDTTTLVSCDGCLEPTFTIMTENPRKLGVITGTT